MEGYLLTTGQVIISSWSHEVKIMTTMEISENQGRFFVLLYLHRNLTDCTNAGLLTTQILPSIQSTGASLTSQSSIMGPLFLGSSYFE